MSLTTDANEWLEARGIKPLPSCISQADEVALKEEIERMREIEHTFHKLPNPCEGDCHGWDGVSSRCECWTQRCCWDSTDSHSFKKPRVKVITY